MTCATSVITTVETKWKCFQNDNFKHFFMTSTF